MRLIITSTGDELLRNVNNDDLINDLEAPKYIVTRESRLLSARLSHGNSVCLSVCPSVCHTGGSVKSSASLNHQIFNIGCLEDSSFRNRKAFP